MLKYDHHRTDKNVYQYAYYVYTQVLLLPPPENFQLREKLPLLTDPSDLKTTKTVEPDDITVEESGVQNVWMTAEFSVEPSYSVTWSKQSPYECSSFISSVVTDIVYIR